MMMLMMMMKNKEERKQPQLQNIMSASATQGGHNKVIVAGSIYHT